MDMIGRLPMVREAAYLMHSFIFFKSQIVIENYPPCRYPLLLQIWQIVSLSFLIPKISFRAATYISLFQISAKEFSRMFPKAYFSLYTAQQGSTLPSQLIIVSVHGRVH